VQFDPNIYLQMHEQEVQRIVKQNALERQAREAGLAQAKREGYPIRPFKVTRIRAGLDGLKRVLRPAGTGSA
jgi:hypothetical protein